MIHLSNKKVHLLRAIITGALALFLTACEQQQSAPATDMVAMPPPTVTVANPLRDEITEWDEFTGRMYAVKLVDVRSRVSGYLKSVNFKEGTIVNKGDLLYVIDPRPYEAALSKTIAEKNRARADLELAEIDLARAEKLYKSKMIPAEELDTRQKQKEERTAMLESAKAAVNEVSLDVEFTHIKAPITGRIGSTNVTEGNLISGGEFDSTLLATIVSLDPIYIYFSADEQAVLHYTRMDMAGTRKSSRVTPNPVYLRLADEEEYMHKGYMDFVDNRIDLNTGTMRVRAIVENPNHLLVPGMFADIKLIGKGPYEALLLPDSAINIDQTIKFVYVIDENNIVSRRQVKIGRLYGSLRVITEGLEADDRVVIDGLQRVRTGTEVSPETSNIDPISEQAG